MDADVLLFFDKQRAALPMYEAFEQALFERLPDTRMKVQKTQISFYNKHQFCCVSVFARAQEKRAARSVSRRHLWPGARGTVAAYRCRYRALSKSLDASCGARFSA